MAVRIWLYVGPWWSLHHKIHCFIPASGLTKLQPFPYTLVDTTLRNGNETMIYFLSHLDRYRWIVMADLVSTRCGTPPSYNCPIVRKAFPSHSAASLQETAVVLPFRGHNITFYHSLLLRRSDAGPVCQHVD